MADRTGLIVVASMATEKVDLPDLSARRQEFDAALVEPPSELSTARRLLNEWGID